MADETYDLNRKIKYLAKDDDNFTIKYTIEIDPNNPSSMTKILSPSQPSQNIKRQESLSKGGSNPRVVVKEASKDPEQTKQKEKERGREKREEKQQRKQQQQGTQQVETKANRNRKMKKKLELNQEQAQILKNLNNFNSKKMSRKRQQQGEDVKVKLDKKKKDKNNTKGRMQRRNVDKEKQKDTQSQTQLEGIYEHMRMPVNRKRISQSIDNNAEKIQQKKKNYLERVDERQKDRNKDPKVQNRRVLYPAYQSIEDIEDSREMKQNKYFKGTIDFSQKIKNYARIFTKQIEGELIVEGINKNRCIHGDEVYFIILPTEDLPADRQKDTLQQKIRCKIVYILPLKDNRKKQIVGKLQFTRANKTYYLIPINKRIISFDVKFSEISHQNLKKANSKYFLAQFTQWKDTDQYPGCRIISEFGAIGDLQTQTSALLINNGVEDKQYDEETIKNGLDKFLKSTDENGQYKIQQQEIKKRTDLRNQFIFTIDPLTAKDFDDALSIVQCGKTENNLKIFEIGVHIADASFFVQQGGVIDDHAKNSTTSVYLVHRVLPMLPRVLCETMCSLNPGLERLTVSIWFKITQQGSVLQGSRYDRSVIKSKARFTYEQAQKIITSEVKSQKQIEPGFGCVKSQDFQRIAQDIRIMNSIAMKIRANRIKKGSLVFETPKKSFSLNLNFEPETISIGKRFEANFLVEEYMLLANGKVGEVLAKNLKQNALLRRHKYPSDKKIEKFQKFTLKINNPIKINKQSPLQEQMNQVLKNPRIKQCIKDILNYQMIFLLEQAEYFLIAESNKEDWLHYALNIPVYTHFTSPIRRYPDIIVHRQLIQVIESQHNNQPLELNFSKSLRQVVDRCNKNKISAKKVSSGCQKIFLCLYLRNNPITSKAVLTDLNKYCLSICVPNYDFRSAIEFKQLKKVKPIQFGKDSSERKYVQLEFQYEAGQTTRIIYKEMQEIDVRLTAKQGFPIDYLIRLVIPHPKNLTQTIICQ